VEEIFAKLRQVEVLTAQCKPAAEATRSIGVTELSQAHGVWRAEARPDETIKGAGGGEPGSVGRCRLSLLEADPERGCLGKLLSPHVGALAWNE
jgi:hypothetical protein